MKTLLSHLCFWRHLGDEAKFAVVPFLPLFIGLVLPIVYPLAISLTYANQSVVERTAVILDLDNTEISRGMVRDLDATQGLEIIRPAESMDDGIEAVMSREADAFLFIPEDFSARIKRFEQGSLKAYVYATNMMIYAAVLGAIQETVLAKNVEIAVEQVANPNGITGESAFHAMDPIAYDRHVLYSPTLAYATYITPIMFTLVFHQMGLILLAFGIGFHRERDPEFAKQRLWFVDYFWRYLFYYGLIFLGTLSVYHGICPLFGWRYGDANEMMKLILCLVACNIPMAIAFASFCRDKTTSFQIILGTTLFFFTMSGYVWPVYAMPDFLKPVTEWINIVPASSAFRKIAFKGASFSECTSEIAQMLKIGLISTGIAILIVHRHLLWRWKKA